jgi:hypothetical protein
MTYKSLILSPRSGVHIKMGAPPIPEPWLIEVWHVRSLNRLELYARGMAVRLGLLHETNTAPKWHVMGSFEVKQ